MTIFAGQEVQAYQALVIASALRYYAKTNVPINRAYTPRNMMRGGEMTREEAVKLIEAEFNSMTGKQRTTLWHTIELLAASQYQDGYRRGSDDNRSREANARSGQDMGQ